MYTQVEDIQTRLTRFGVPDFADDTEPSTDEVERYISDIESEINGVLNALSYPTIPVDNPEDFGLLRRYTADKVASMVYLTYFVVDQVPPFVVQTWVTDYRDFLNRLRKGDQVLAGAVGGVQEPEVYVGNVHDRDTIFPDLSGYDEILGSWLG